MDAPSRRPCARQTDSTPSDTLLALDCARNVYQAIDRRMAEASALAAWLVENAAPFGLSDGAVPDACNLQASRRRRGVSIQDWRKIGAALTEARACQPTTTNVSTNRWTAAIANRLALDPLDARILALGLHYQLDNRVERLFDEISRCRGGLTTFHRDAGLTALLLRASPGEVATRFTGEARLLASGLLQLRDHGRLSVSERLVSLIRRETLPEADIYDQLLGTIAAEPLPWDAFTHLGREAEVAATVVAAALAGRERGVNILLYGLPGTGKTSFAATLAARVGVRLRPVAETDEDGGEPSRNERLAGLRLAQRLAVPGETLLLFDEAEDLFASRNSDPDDPVINSRVFIHRMLERTAVPVIWTANNIGVLGPAVARRMTMCLELRVPNLATRMSTPERKCIGVPE